MTASGWVLINCLRMLCSTGMDWNAHSVRRLPASARAISLMSQAAKAVVAGDDIEPLGLDFSKLYLNRSTQRAAITALLDSRRSSALSDASHVKESSVLPKCPNAAVLR